MDIEVQISFDVNAVFVQAGKLNKKFANLIAYEKGFNKIIAIGETEEKIAARDPEHWERIKGTVAFKPIFDPHNFDAESIYWGVRMLASNVHHELRGVNLFDRLNCDVNIPMYEMAPLNSIEHFERRMERWPKLHSLKINGTTAIFKGPKYYLIQFALNWGWRIFLGIVVAIFIIRSDIFFTILRPLLEKLSFGVIFLAAFLALGMLWTSEMLWLVVMQWALPKRTLQRMFAVYQLQFAPENKVTVSKMLAEWILGKND